ncbi:MAG: hypothetical protein QMO91_04470 [Candidatus Tisiphia sp.]|nr:hypothetical protein [Candidatus Tisiphia sp.]
MCNYRLQCFVLFNFQQLWGGGGSDMGAGAQLLKVKKGVKI